MRELRREDDINTETVKTFHQSLGDDINTKDFNCFIKMTQYLMKKDKDFKNLRYALDNYKPLDFYISPKAFTDRTKSFHENLEGKTLDFSVDNNSNNLNFYVNKKEIIKLSLEEYYGFKLEYWDLKGMRLLPQVQFPNDLEKEPDISAFRGIIDDYLIEIKFKGKILLKPEKDYSEDRPFWTLK